jgi:phytoene dehydrogenase-like protein
VTTADVVVAGAGHNSLICAAYLARAGREVVVLDARPVPGGGAVTEELLGSGYAIDSCSTGHTLIQTNPLLARDELGLLGEQGVEYLAPDPVAHVAFPDGRQLTMWLDVERTVEELTRFSRRDAAAYRRLLADYDAVKDAFNASRFTPVGMGPSLEQRLREHPQGGVWLRRNALSAYEVVRHEFESPHVRAFLLWQAFQTLVSVDLPGSGRSSTRSSTAASGARGRCRAAARDGSPTRSYGSSRRTAGPWSAGARSPAWSWRAAAARAWRRTTASAGPRARPSSRPSTSRI